MTHKIVLVKAKGTRLKALSFYNFSSVVVQKGQTDELVMYIFNQYFQEDFRLQQTASRPNHTSYRNFDFNKCFANVFHNNIGNCILVLNRERVLVSILVSKLIIDSKTIFFI